MNIGLDFGGVIIDSQQSAEFLLRGNYDQIISIPAMPKAIESIKEISSLENCNLWIITKASEKTCKNTMTWLKSQDFFEKTGIPADHILCCKKRIDKKKLCEANFIDVFLDDTIDVLDILQGSVKHLYHFNNNVEYQKGAFEKVRDWNHFYHKIIDLYSKE